MGTIGGAAYGLSAAYAHAGDLVKTLSTVTKLACTAIGRALQIIADRLIEMAAEAATPVIGWAVGAARAYSNVQKVVQTVRLIYTIIETIISAIQDFVQAKTAILDKAALIEDLAQGAAASAA
jgi:hypothetical protein